MNLLHLLIPHYKNNFRAKILHHSSLLIIIFAFTAVTFIGAIVSKSHPEVLGISYQITDQELLNLVNFERKQKGLVELKLNTKLSDAARKKAEHMFQNNYWAHFAPDGTTPWVFIKDQDYEYIYAGENLAKGYTTSYDAVKAWMESQTHRENILSDKYNDLGFAIVEGNLEGEQTILIVQMFGSTKLTDVDSTSKEVGQKIAVKQDNVLKSQTMDDKDLRFNEVKISPLIDLVFSTKAIVFSILSILITALVIDLIIIEKNKIPRIVGNNLDHIILLTLFMLFMFMSKLGRIM